VRLIDMHVNPLKQPDLARVTAATLADLMEATEAMPDSGGEPAALRGVMVVLNPRMFDGAHAIGAALERRGFVLASSVDLAEAGTHAAVERLAALGARALKFHPYLQRIDRAQFSRACELARTAQSLGMFVMVCGSYGTRALGRYSGVELASALSDHVTCPIVLSHAGGAKVLDAMLLAADAVNVYLDTSFSVPYYIGSSVETDFAFAMRKLGTHRWVYGSDAPFYGPKEALAVTLQFFERHRFTTAEIDDVLYVTAARLLGGQRGRP